jgi:hypothetical protein
LPAADAAGPAAGLLHAISPWMCMPGEAGRGLFAVRWFSLQYHYSIKNNLNQLVFIYK